MNLTVCEDCHRPIRRSEAACPFCGHRLSGPLLDRLRPRGRVLSALGASATAVVLAACYGAPPCKDCFDSGDTGAAEDTDGDGFDTRVDCDDSDPLIHPEAVEVCDDTKDNDCDGTIDADDTDCAVTTDGQ